MNRERSSLSMRCMLPGYSFEPRPIMLNRRVLDAICREFYLFTRCYMYFAGLRTSERKSVRKTTKTLVSPQMPVKLGITKLRKDEKDSCCLCSGINLYGAESTYNLTSLESLAKK